MAKLFLRVSDDVFISPDGSLYVATELNMDTYRMEASQPVPREATCSDV